MYSERLPNPDFIDIHYCADASVIARRHKPSTDFDGALLLVINVRTGLGGSTREAKELVCDAIRQVDIVTVAEGRGAGDHVFVRTDVSLIKNLGGFGSGYEPREGTERIFVHFN